MFICAVVLAGNSPAQNVWTQKADFPGDPRTSCVGFSIGAGGFIGLGFDSVEFRRSFYSYAQATNTWIQVTSLGGVNGSGLSRDAAVSFVVGTKAYVGTGQGSVSYLNDMWEYNGGSDTWTQKANFPGTARRKAVGFAVNGKGYVGLGQDQNGFRNDFFEYDPVTNTWVGKASFPSSPRQLAVAFVIGSTGYVGTGDDGVNKSDFYQYNPATNTWSAIAPFGGTPRKGAVAFSLNGKGYVGTGYDNSLANRSDFWEFYPGTGTWTQVMDFGGGLRASAVGFAIGTRGYVGTGYEGTPKKDFWEFTPPVGIVEEHKNGLSVNVFPNPVTSTSVISISGNSSNEASCEIMNLEGKIVARPELRSDFSFLFEKNDLNPGIYFVHVLSGAFSGTRKLVISH